MAHSVDPRRNRAKPGVSSGHRSRLNDEDSVRGPHQGQQSTRTAPTGRTHDCKRPLRCTPNDLLPGGGHPHMKRREFITLLGSAAAAPSILWPRVARAQNERMRRIGFLTTLSESDPEVKGWLTAFQAEMQRLGWTLGRNFSIEYRWPGSNEQRLRSSAAELVKTAPEVIFPATTPALGALHRENRSPPIVFVQVSDPVKLGFVANLAR